MIKVMEHFENGGEVESLPLLADVWKDDKSPSWNWSMVDYRIKEVPKEYEVTKT